jgi:hypothetical protein
MKHEEQERQSPAVTTQSVRPSGASVAATSHARTEGIRNRTTFRRGNRVCQERYQARPSITPGMVANTLLNGLITALLIFVFTALYGVVFG